ncbi:hypothetical protein HYY69_05925 [Candidatus Woesearchaeota archaeon]|nr:hypothetical protein [Candidatus Woesearchaeota archaeon]
MRITIDTKHDSPEEIRKMVNFLNTVLADQGYGEQVSLNTENKQGDIDLPSPNLFNVFGNASSQNSSSSGSESSSSSSSSSDKKQEPKKEEFTFDDLDTYGG